MKYKSVEELLKDVKYAATELLQHGQVLAEQVNGEVRPKGHIDGKAREQIIQITSILNDQMKKFRNGAESRQEEQLEASGMDLDNGNMEESTGHVLTLRTYTDRGPRQVYSGLQADPTIPIDSKSLPNGFEVIDSAPVSLRREPNVLPRTFGTVFRPHRNSKPLEAPKPTRAQSHLSELNFVSDLDNLFNRITSAYKQDYSFARVPAGEWLRYAGDEKHLRKPQEIPHSGQDDLLGSDRTEAGSLFRATYSSFAPSYDNSAAIIPESLRNELWWNKKGRRRFESIFSYENLEEKNREHYLSDSGLDFSNLASDLVSMDESDAEEYRDSDPTTVDEILADVSQLIETLASYQRIRHLEDTNLRSNFTEPSQPEFETYELLKTQLAVIVGSLPPFMVAKLNGDQLGQLNIKSQIVLKNDDYVGSGETDGYYIRPRGDAASITASAMARPNASTPAPVRPGAFTPQPAIAAANYNARARVYNATPATSVAATYGSSVPNAAPYQTPRPPSTTPRPHYQPYQQSSTPAYTTQQFQRSTSDVYGNYVSTNTPSYIQRPSQPDYQKRAQERDTAMAALARSTSPQHPTHGSYHLGNPNVGVYARSTSPQKPLVNGQAYNQAPSGSQMPQTQTGYAQQLQMPSSLRPPTTYGTQANAMIYASPAQREKMEHLRDSQQAHIHSQPQQTQGSSTPQPPPSTPISGAGGYGRYDGTSDTQRSVSGVSEVKREMSASVGAEVN